MSNVYRIYDFWNEETYDLTAKELVARVVADSRNHFNWIATPAELVRICKLKTFPDDCATIIKMEILKCYGILLCMANNGCEGCYTSWFDEKAIEYCFNSLAENEETIVQSAREYWLSQKIEKAAFINPYSYYGRFAEKQFHQIKTEWINEKVKEFIAEKRPFHESVMRKLEKEFMARLKKAEAEGRLDKDKAYYKESIKKIDEMISKIGN